MAHLKHGDLTFHLPEGWVDGSQLMFLAPVDGALAEELRDSAARTRGGPIQLPVSPRISANVTFSSRPYFLAMAGGEFCERELRAMLGAIPKAKVSDFCSGQLGPFEASTAELEISADGISAKQLHALAVGKGRLYHFCATATLGDYDRVKAELVRIMTSLEVDSAPNA
ncbi:MAG: hypothetical protein IT384_28755 [Deltaproteobacteria bacterium]|nr:hypothetical protein [Deltaproteobacteria bacterium]